MPSSVCRHFGSKEVSRPGEDDSPVFAYSSLARPVDESYRPGGCPRRFSMNCPVLALRVTVRLLPVPPPTRSTVVLAGRRFHVRLVTKRSDEALGAGERPDGYGTTPSCTSASILRRFHPS